MASKNDAKDKYTPNGYEKLVRKNGQGWNTEKYARMGVYVYLFNRIKGRPTKWNLTDQDVGLQYKDVIQNRWEEVVKEYVPGGKISGMDLNDPNVKAKFMAEMNDYNEHALQINPEMPSTTQMINFLQDVSLDKNDFYMNIHKSVQEKAGEWRDEKHQQGSLIAERANKNREIDDLQYEINKDTFWTGMKGAGAVGSAGATVGSVVGLVFLPFPLNLVVGLGGGITGFVGPKGRPLSLTESEIMNIRLEALKADDSIKPSSAYFIKL